MKIAIFSFKLKEIKIPYIIIDQNGSILEQGNLPYLEGNLKFDETIDKIKDYFRKKEVNKIIKF